MSASSDPYTRLLRKAASVGQLERRARARLPRFAWDYLEGGCFDEVALRRSRRVLDSVCIEPRYLAPPCTPDLAVDLFGKRHAAPFGVAPMGLGGLMWPGMAEHLAVAAKAAGLPFGLSTTATTSIERIGELTGGDFWFQLYAPVDGAVRDDLLARARRAGCDVLIVTVDVPVSGRRPRDLRNGLSLPPQIDWRTVLQACARPRWSWQTLRAGRPRFLNLDPYVEKGADLTRSSAFFGRRLIGGIDPADLKTLRRLWPGILVVKGVMSLADARQAQAAGADGIIVSNHGGRQLDAAPAPIEPLPEIVDAVGGDIVVMADGAVTSGVDIARYLACGARFVFAGRAFAYAVCGLGPQGAAFVTRLLTEELWNVLGQIRCRCPGDLPAHLVGGAPTFREEQVPT